MISLSKIPFIALCCWLVMISFAIQAQFRPVPVEKSNEKILYKGKVYYLHSVKPGHTLYSICKAYGISKDNISEANPDVTLNPISAGAVLKIPITVYDHKNNQEELKGKNTGFIYHTVQPGQTVYYLHKRYEIPLELIYKYNQEAVNGLKPEQVIRIPVGEVKQDPMNTAFQDKPEGILYTVSEGDTLYRLSKEFGVSVAEIINANAVLRWGLKAGQIITIPKDSSGFSMHPADVQDSILLVSDIAQLSEAQCDSIVDYNHSSTIEPVNIALLLPFHAEETFRPDTMSLTDSLTPHKIQLKKSSFRRGGALEFYEGFLLALDSLKNTGININLFVFDTEADTSRVKIIIEEFESIHPNLIIGTFTKSNSHLISKYAAENKIPFVAPLMKDDSLTKKNPYLFQVNPSQDSEIEIYTEYLSQFHNDNIIIISKQGLKHASEINSFKEKFSSQLKLYNFYDTLPYKEVIFNDSLVMSLKNALDDSIRNIVIVLSPVEAEVSRALSLMQYEAQQKDILVFGLPAWQKFHNVRISLFHDLQVTLYSPFHIDYNDPDVKSFVLSCREKLLFEPYRTTSKGSGVNYTFLGYDLGMYFITLLNRYGNNTCDCASHFDLKLLLSEYKFRRNSYFGCFENNSVNLLRYRNDIVVEKIKYNSLRYK